MTKKRGWAESLILQHLQPVVNNKDLTLLLFIVQDRLKEDLKNPEFKQHYEEERTALALAYKIHTLREEKNLTQQELAKLMETSQQAVSRIESGEYEGMTLKTLEKIAKATGTWLRVDFVTV